MLQVIQSNLQRYFTKGHERSLKAKKNIIQSVILKGGSVIISFLLIPLTIRYINPTQYGIWLTLSSIITWAGLFDMGLGNGLRNKLAAMITLDDVSAARSYVSSTYALLLIISTVMFTVFFIVNPYINWQQILNAHNTEANYLSLVVLVVFGFFCFQFVIQLINNVLTANQAPAKTALLNLIGQLLSLIVVLFLIRYKQGALMDVVIIIAGLPLIALLAGSIWYYNGMYKMQAPAFRFVNFRHAKELLGIGGGFFIIQINALVLYETDNIVITQIFGPKEVTTFNVAYKLFSIILMFFVIVITPFWSAFTEAYTKNDYDWIKSTLAKINKLWIALSFCTVCLLVLSPWLYDLWLGKSIAVPVSLSIAMCLYTITIIWQAIHVQFLNGVGKIKLQLYLGIIGSIVNVPLSVFLGRKVGVAGVTLSNVILFIVMGIVFSIQTKKLISKTATGIFNA
ncbi:oligosaccharide flippase family protein [Mucilaginibacter sabulilitoris]|uniref:Oligosaccharide flippase family protein n=1 Tax=Mucilaginibacter sabulilitoris TaxID=1173583 RepID=A0ABZ0TY54_9SPHI|nr:oligosaccharide flippase family protein [Mucilaginibacter sabulilitoris]WPU96739.1 oligosaccharide flippase family protein [Mucilaginibacter sabulilitoris]